MKSGQEGPGNPVITRGIQLPLSCACFFKSVVFRLLFRASFLGSNSGSKRRDARKRPRCGEQDACAPWGSLQDGVRTSGHLAATQPVIYPLDF